ncbi:hypothetical protein [uncultured Psychroserpens sp.]|uniref:hypothetical protein n=1 Tax=uncultured Psychroserpens sp. TaxID=255436 RepID=UPI00261FEFAC|nr:hypothetical protein [uncultured Psychroserpens sp.]
MKTVFFVIFFVFLTIPWSQIQAQNNFAILEKNVNVRAKGLTQELNTTKDTLILKSEKRINKVYAVNMNYKREVDIEVKTNSVKIPLTNLSKGKHVFVAVQSPIRYVFVIKILRDDTILLAMEDDQVASKNDE